MNLLKKKPEAVGWATPLHPRADDHNYYYYLFLFLLT